MDRNFVVFAEIVEVGVSLSYRPENLSCEYTAAWDEHFQARRKYFKALDAYCNAERLVVLCTNMAASASEASAEYASETAHHVRKFLARSAVGKIGIPELCEV